MKTFKILRELADRFLDWFWERVILGIKPDDGVLRCPTCGSAQVEYGRATTRYYVAKRRKSCGAVFQSRSLFSAIPQDNGEVPFFPDRTQPGRK